MIDTELEPGSHRRPGSVTNVGLNDYDVWCPELGLGPEKARLVIAVDGEQAAAEWAYHADRDRDYLIVGGQDVRVCVLMRGRSQIGEYLVRGRVERSYAAHAVSARDKGEVSTP